MATSLGAFVIVGGGQAGAWVARTLRKEGFAGPVVLIGDEEHWPYERPPLSKAFLQGTSDIAAMTLLGADQAAELGIECLRGRRVTAVDRLNHTVTCADGTELSYGRLFLTTGGKARTLPWLEGDASGRIHTLRTQGDAERLRTALHRSESLLVLGGGWIGLEVAATARAMGVAVTVVEAGARLCARTMPPVVSEYLHGLHAAEGVVLRMGAAVTGLRPDEAGVTATFGDGTVLRAGHAVIGIGISPDTALAAACGLEVADGIVVDAQGRTSDPAIFAAGDVARHPNDFAGLSLRLESWANAQNGAIVAAKASLGHDVRYAEVPWFWSDQYGANLQMLGLPGAGVRSVARGAPDAGAGCWLMLDANGAFAGAVAVNAPRELRTVRKMLAAASQPCPDAWADPAVPLARVGAIPLPAAVAAAS